MSDLCQSLEAEHRVIEKVLDAMMRELKEVKGGAAVDRPFFERVITFIREFADGLHHRKEEQVLFPRLKEAGVPEEGGPVGVMLYEHNEGRSLVHSMEAALGKAAIGDRAACDTLVRTAGSFVDLLRAHIMKEDGVLFPMADRVFDESRKAVIREGFTEAEAVEAERDLKHRRWAEGLA